ncbi:MAG: hypothetical protein LBE82_06825 [Chitinophagaceae bacterium]|jgi:lipopolysaccharide export system protein LptA|nr:hypothetical protein [Chitinophagaceae bacterium]
MFCFSGHAQGLVDTTNKGDKIIVITQIQRQQVIKKDSSNLTIMVGNVGLQQGSTKLYCDSLVQNNTTSIIEAFKNVHINDEDSVHIYADYLLYNTKTKKAFLSGNVKLIDRNKVTLTTKQLDYDLNTKIGTYSFLGKIVNKSTVLTSLEGIYDAQTHDARFKKNVVVTDTAYTIKTDTLLYNTETQVTTFVVPTEIVSSKRKIITTDGYYDKLSGKSFFGKRSTVFDSSTTLVADQIADSTIYGEAQGNVVMKDTAQGIVLICNNLKMNRENNSYLATITPIMIIKQENDSLFITADTLYSARLSDRLNSTDSGKINKTPININDSAYTHSVARQKDTAALKMQEHNLKEKIPTDSTAVNAPRYVTKNGQVIKEDLVPVEKPKETVIANAKQIPQKIGHSPFSKIRAYGPSTKQKEQLKDTANTALRLTTDSTQAPLQKEPPKIKPNATSKTKDLASNKKEKRKPEKNSTNALQTQAEKPQTALAERSSDSAITARKKEKQQEYNRTNHYLEAYYHVRIYSDSMQAVGDSLFYSFKDSTFRLFKNPIVWSQDNQLLGDTIYLNTENKKPKHIYVYENAFAISKAEGVFTNNLFYNQLKGRTIEGWFTNGDIDSLHTKGSPAESVYYIVGDDKKYTGVDKITSSAIDMYYLDKKPFKIAARSDIKGMVYPMRQANHEDLKLRGFKWYEDRRPKSKYELLGKSVN